MENPKPVDNTPQPIKPVESEALPTIEHESIEKPKKKLSDKQLENLAKGRELAKVKRDALKSETKEKNIQKRTQNLKQYQAKKELTEDEMLKKATTEAKKKIREEKKQQKLNTIVEKASKYVLEQSSSEESDEGETVVMTKKRVEKLLQKERDKSKPTQQPTKPVQQAPQPKAPEPPKKPSFMDELNSGREQRFGSRKWF